MKDDSYLFVATNIQSGNLFYNSNISRTNLFVPVEDTDEITIYRADTTVLTSDTTLYTADYSL